jgi:hypothetical protein
MDYLIKVKTAKYLGDFRIFCLFSNGEERIIDLENDLTGEMFEPLKDKNIFMQFSVDDTLKTIVWPNGADIAPYSLYEIGEPIRKRTKKSSRLKSKTKQRI